MTAGGETVAVTSDRQDGRRRGGAPGDGSRRADPSDGPRQVWHAMTAADTLAVLETDDRGLSDDEARRRHREHGPNRLSATGQRTALKRLIAQFNNLFMLLLLAAAAMAGGLGEWLDASVIVGVVAVIAGAGFYQEGRAEQALEAVRGMLSSRATVLRDGEPMEVDAATLTPGDVVQLKSGDKVPADLRIVRSRNLQMQEAVLTGESQPVEKSAEPVDEGAGLGDRTSMLYSGTLVTTGRGTGVVVAIGDRTELGRIGGMLSGIETLKTPLMERFDRFTIWLSIGIVAVASFTFLFGLLFRDEGAADMFFVAVSIIVGSIPEGLPIIMTIGLAVGVQRMARRNCIIRRLPAVETLGSVTVICSDKTGTLTRNEMTVQTIVAGNGCEVGVSGVGYLPEGELAAETGRIRAGDDPVIDALLHASVLCNDAGLAREGDGWRVDGDPMEGALLVLGAKAGIDRDALRRDRRRIDAVPFESERRYMATLHEGADGRVLYAKGAPERILDLCAGVATHDGPGDLDVRAWHSRVETVAERGQRVLALASKHMPADRDELHEDDVQDLTLLGIVGLIDPPREEAIEAIEDCRNAGIRAKMITGDHALTAAAIAAQLGLENTERVLTGKDFEALSDDELEAHARSVDVYARTSPEHKLRLVEALQRSHEIVAMTGDGVNDAPALKRANIGVAMGRTGTEATKEAAEMVLVDDNFASIARAVHEGRHVYDNLRKSILFLLPTSIAQGLVIVVAVVVGALLPLTPVQVLWVNMATAITLGLALAFEPAERDIMRRPPRPTHQPLLTPFFLWRVVFVPALLLAGTLGAFFATGPANDLALARTAAVNTLVAGQIFYLFCCRFYVHPSYTIGGLTGNRTIIATVVACIGLQALITYTPFMNTLFGTAPLALDSWLLIAAVGFGIFVAVEVEKTVIRWRLSSTGGTIDGAVPA
jgi:magnesium-transporting ATPase (P-type)